MEKNDTIVDSPFVMETVDHVALQSYNFCLGDVFFLLLLMIGKEFVLLMS